MTIKRVRINGYKSIKNCDLYIGKENLFVGENGSGKSNFISAIKYFYSNLVHKNKSEYVFDENNKYCNEVLISIDYDLSEIHVAAIKNKDRYESYYKKIESIYNKGNNGILRVEMRQIKSAEISWNIGYSDRQTIKNIFEIYDLNDGEAGDKWDLIWVLLGDYFKGSNELNKIIKENLKSGLLEIEEFKGLNKKYEILDDMLEKEGLKFKEWTNREYSSQLMKLLFRGDEFVKDNKGLNYFSRGTDLFNFYSITIGIIGQISINKLKRPTILFDEPENNLHHKYIDKFVDLLNSRSNKLSFIVSTHSSRLMKNAIRTDLIYNTVHVYKDPRGYSFYKKIKLNRNTDRRHMYHLSDEDANAYFSRYMVLVEGETELEVFNNLAVRKIFNKTYDIDFYRVVTEKPREDLISPNKTQAETLFYSLLDIDKIIIYKNNNHIELNHRDLFRSLDRDTEKYLINRRNSQTKLRDDTYFRFKKINNMIKERNEKADSLVEVNSDLQHKGSEFKNLIFKGNIGVLVYDQRIKDELKKYLDNYNIYFFETTIEGAIINKSTIRYIDEYVLYKILQEAYFSMDSFKKIQYKYIIKSKINCYKDNYIKILDKYNDEIKVEIIRMLFGGKTSSLMKYNNFTEYIDSYIENHKSNPDSITDEYTVLKNDTEKVKSIIGFNKKTSWTSDFFSYYYLRNLYGHRNFKKEYKIIYLFKSIDTILSYCDGVIELTEQRQAQLVNNLDKYFGNFVQNISKANRTILFSSNNNNKKMIDKMKRDFPEINDLIELFI